WPRHETWTRHRGVAAELALLAAAAATAREERGQHRQRGKSRQTPASGHGFSLDVLDGDAIARAAPERLGSHRRDAIHRRWLQCARRRRENRGGQAMGVHGTSTNTGTNAPP